jgi:hypothetical protein
MDDKEKPAIEKVAGKVNDVVEEITLKAADVAIEPDPEHVAGAANEQVYLPEATETLAGHSGRVTPTHESMLPPFVVIPRRKKSTSKKAPKKTAKKAAKKFAKKSAKTAKKASAKKAVTKTTKKAARESAAKKSKKTAKKSSVRPAKKAKRKSKK